ncbi:cyclase family protein [Pseudomonas fulva]|uniref:cyclase family protein n=1 Tax=Pseudomonas fulva TaxID=47880 RepID=UPI003CEDD342
MDFSQCRLVDISVTLDNNPYTDPPPLLPRIDYMDHQQGWPEMAALFPGLRKEDLPGDESWAAERLHITTHSGTHMDAPWHYASTTDHALYPAGKPAFGIDELPLEWCLRPGVKLDLRHLPDGHVVSAQELASEFGKIGYTLAPLDIVLINTRAGELFGEPGYLDAGVGIGRDATLWLLDQGVRVVGTDAWSWDAPFSHTRARFAQTGDASIIWEGHKAGRDIGYGQMEKLSNLHVLPTSGFWVSCFPYKIRAASAGFVRAVAMLPA